MGKIRAVLQVEFRKVDGGENLRATAELDIRAGNSVDVDPEALHLGSYSPAILTPRSYADGKAHGLRKSQLLRTSGGEHACTLALRVLASDSSSAVLEFSGPTGSPTV